MLNRNWIWSLKEEFVMGGVRGVSGEAQRIDFYMEERTNREIFSERKNIFK